MCLRKIIFWKKPKPNVEITLNIDIQKYDEINFLYNIKSLSLSDSINKNISLEININNEVNPLNINLSANQKEIDINYTVIAPNFSYTIYSKDINVENTKETLNSIKDTVNFIINLEKKKVDDENYLYKVISVELSKELNYNLEIVLLNNNLDTLNLCIPANTLIYYNIDSSMVLNYNPQFRIYNDSITVGTINTFITDIKEDISITTNIVYQSNINEYYDYILKSITFNKSLNYTTKYYLNFEGIEKELIIEPNQTLINLNIEKLDSLNNINNIICNLSSDNINIIDISNNINENTEAEYPKAPVYFPLPNGEFPIRGSRAFSNVRDDKGNLVLNPDGTPVWEFITEKQVKLARECGLNVLLGATGVTDQTALQNLLISLNMYDMFITVVHSWMYGHEYENGGLIWAKNMVKPFENNIFQYNVKDEPFVNEFENLKEQYIIAYEEFPKLNGFINLFPYDKTNTWGAKNYYDYVDQYVKIVNPAFICYDIYPVKCVNDGTASKIYIDDSLWITTETIYQIAKKSRRPFYHYILSGGNGKFYPKPKEEYIRYQVFQGLAYGSQGIHYWTYVIPRDQMDANGNYGYYDNPIDQFGNPTDTYYMVQQVNKEVKALKDLFLDNEVIEVGHLNGLPESATMIFNNLPSPFKSITSNYSITVSNFKDKNNNTYLMLVNDTVINDVNITINTTKKIDRIYYDKTETINTTYSFILDKGGYAIFKY